MKAFAFQKYGSELQEVNLPRPELRPHEVLVQIAAAGVNHIDERIRRGDLRRIEQFHLPLVLGVEFSGEVVAVGDLVREFTPGMQVFAMADLKRAGAFAEYVAIDQRLLAPIPVSLNTINAAALPLAGLTAWQALVDIGQIHAGQKVLIHGGTGGIGSVAIQLAKHLGARVTTTVGSTNVRLARELGADTVINYSSEDFVRSVQGMDLVLDTQGGVTLQKSLQVVRNGGRVVSLTFPPDPIYAAQIEADMLTRAAIRMRSSGVRRRARQVGADYRFLFTRPDAEQLRALAQLVDRGEIRPVIDRILPFEETPQAVQTLLHGGLRGKVLVRRR